MTIVVAVDELPLEQVTATNSDAIRAL